jgi:lipopolysaccharide transport system permease protein
VKTPALHTGETITLVKNNWDKFFPGNTFEYFFLDDHFDQQYKADQRFGQVFGLLFLVIVVGFSLGASVLFLRYRDLNQVWEVIVQAGFFLAPVVYPLRVMPERYHFFFYLWPPTAVIEFSRSVLVAGIVPSGRAHVLLTLEAACVLAVGILVFRRYSPRAAEHI